MTTESVNNKKMMVNHPPKNKEEENLIIIPPQQPIKKRAAWKLENTLKNEKSPIKTFNIFILLLLNDGRSKEPPKNGGE